MEALLKSEKALDILCTISLAQFLIIAVIFIGIGVIAFKFRGRIKEIMENYRTKENQKEDLLNQISNHEKEIQIIKKHHDQDMKDFYERQLQYRTQSLEKQEAINNKFSDINTKIDSLTNLVITHYEETKKLKRNELREKLLTSYRHFTSLETNPKQEWNEMESEAFWHLFEDYEELGGNGYMHNVVKPAMEKLTIVSI